MKYKWKGISDEVFTCCACGKNDLKKTIVLEGENGEIEYFGCCCASKVLGWSYNKTLKEQEKEIRKQKNLKKKEQEELIKKARIQYNNHPNIVKINCEITEANRNNITAKERQEKGLFARWNKLKQQAREEILNRFNLPGDTYL